MFGENQNVTVINFNMSVSVRSKILIFKREFRKAVAEKDQSQSTTARHSSTARAVVEAHQSYGTTALHSSMARAVAEVD